MRRMKEGGKRRKKEGKEREQAERRNWREGTEIGEERRKGR